MKTIFRFIASTIIGTAFLGSMASAATCDGTISITGTGPGSNNQISCADVSNIVVTCDNNIVVATVNTQTGTSGSADSSDNTTAGTATSGSVVNDNGQNVTVGASCVTPVVPASVTPAGGGGGAGGAGEVPEVLPNTSGETILPLILATLAASVVVTTLSHAAITLYRRISLK